MYMLGKEKSSKISQILASSYYQKWVKYFQGVLRLTRDKRYRTNGKKLLVTQYGIAKTETQLWEKLKEGRELAKKYHDKPNLTDKEERELKGIENHIFIHEQLIRISKTICDGIAWRNLNYNQMFLLSAARGFGYVAIDYKSKDFRGMYIVAYNISERLGSTVIINDLTRFLRIGDLTDIKDGVPFIHELKEYGKEVKNMFTLRKVKGKISRQAVRLLELQRIALSAEAKVGNQIIGKSVIDLPLQTNLAKVERLIKRSKKEIIVHEQVESFLTIEVTNFQEIKSHKGFDIEAIKAKSSRIRADIVHSNWDSFYSDERGNFMRMFVPYSIFPFTNENCINLMSGNYLVKSMLSISKLKEFLIQNGWEIEDVDEAALDRQIKKYDITHSDIFSLNNPLYTEDTLSDIGLFTVRKGPFSMSMDTWLYGKLTSEYLTSKCILDILNFAYERAAKRQSGDSYFPVFKDESKLWN
ncbi:hypothetical protein A2634_05465 [Candidatus Amesbacteria bacterium RIFCSPHIGHO2_01_FULL_48_32]|uniref:Uncharacterized protein n=2 Tax=Microgenomates group TaxID=1794810 RepID=A0A1F4ZAE4_9BACT|nr:MAG: hypothetical protein A2634_05465 [Candidatus Amesbacteria bacterium RIFCSPHIGHO2_01_FULL_48_32]OGD03155.1 MAG: hypothetical protein A2989_02350 [Candidatus Amesbacteria bacterium RIFCSPLOWO2_01_FULL_48_25]